METQQGGSGSQDEDYGSSHGEGRYMIGDEVLPPVVPKTTEERRRLRRERRIERIYSRQIREAATVDCSRCVVCIRCREAEAAGLIPDEDAIINEIIDQELDNLRESVSDSDEEIAHDENWDPEANSEFDDGTYEDDDAAVTEILDLDEP